MIDTEGLLREISPDDPCGDDLEYDPSYGVLERAARGKPEQRIGDTVHPAEPPVWRDVRDKSIELLGRTKDLRVALHLTRALSRIDGWSGAREGLALVKGLLDRYWDTVHPRLDPNDNDDPTLRVNVIASICDYEAMLDVLRSAPLVTSRLLGTYSLRDVQVASGELSAPRDNEARLPEMPVIEAALREADLEQLQATSYAITQTIEIVNAIESTLTERVGPSSAPDLEAFVSLARAAHKVLAAPLSERVTVSQATGDELQESRTEHEPEQSASGQSAPTAVFDAIRSREDVVRALDLVCRYYEREEPSSPVPILIGRARRLVHKNFMEILRDLAPDGVSQAETIRGPESGD